MNCWEFKKCGRKPDGAKCADLGICPATIDTSVDGLNGGKNGGRICWAVAGTFCGGKVQGEFAQKMATCLACVFYKKVKAEEHSSDFLMLKPGQKYKQHE